MQTRVLFLGCKDDEPFLWNLTTALGPLKSTTIANLRKFDFISEIAATYKCKGVTHVITTQEHLISMLCDTASTKEQKLSNYAGSMITDKKSGLIFLFISPLKQCMTIPYGKFLLERYVSKITNPNKWVQPNPFSFTLLTDSNYNSALAVISNAIICAVDIETRPDLSISSVSYTSIFISPITHKLTSTTYVMPIPYELEVDEYEIIFMWLGKFNATNTPKVFQNGKYDCAYFQRFGIPVVSYLFDTQICHHVWLAELPKDLGVLGAFYLRDSIFWKHEGDSGNAYDLYNYNGLDTYNTAWVFIAWILEAPEWAKNNYLMEFPVLFPYFLCESTGLAVNETVFEEVLATETNKKITALLDCQQNLGEPKFNPGSSQQTFKVMTALGCKDLKKADEKAMKRAAFRHPFNHFILHKIIEYRKAAKLVSTYLNPLKLYEGRVLYSISPTTETGRSRSSEHAFWTGCMPTKEAMAYTPDGWVSIETRPEIIAQWNWNSEISFVPVTWNMYEITDTLYGYDSRCVKGLFTWNHKVPVIKQNRPNRDTTWKAASETSLIYTPVTGFINNDSCAPQLTESWLRKCVMLSADGSRDSQHSWRIAVKKQAKKDRIYELTMLSEKHSQKCPEGYVRFRIEDAGYFKEFPEWFLHLDLSQRLIILDELKYWDSHIRGASYIYSTTIKGNAELIATMAHISGKSASLSVNLDNNRGYGSGNNKPVYSVNISSKQLSAIEGKRVYSEHYSGEVGCPTTDSGYWLVKFRDGIHVTGNCNIQNIPRNGGIKRFMEADDGFLLGEADYSQAESRDTGYITGDITLINNVENKERDFHKSNASMFFGVPYEQVDKELRQLSKPVNHGANYLMSDDTLIDSMGLENVFLAASKLNLPRLWTARHITTHLLKLFAATYKVVAHDYPQYIKITVARDGHLVNPYGWVRKCFGDPVKNRSALRQLVAHLPQGTNGQALNKAAINIFNNIWKQHSDNFKMSAFVHDSTLFQYREGHEYLADMVAQEMIAASTIDVTDIKGVTRKMVIPVDISIGGKSWQDSKDH